MKLLAKAALGALMLAGTAAAAHCPFLSAASEESLGLESFTGLGTIRDVSTAFAGTDSAMRRERDHRLGLDRGCGPTGNVVYDDR